MFGLMGSMALLYDAAVVVQAEEEDAEGPKDADKVMSWLDKVLLMTPNNAYMIEYPSATSILRLGGWQSPNTLSSPPLFSFDMHLLSNLPSSPPSIKSSHNSRESVLDV